jgi:nucleoid-associated protein YgaU
MHRTRVRRRRLGAALLGLGIVAGFAGTAASASGPSQGDDRLIARHLYVVRAGDTLWAVAEHRTGGEDPRPLVDAIVEANDVDAGGIVPGQTLIVPAAG